MSGLIKRNDEEAWIAASWVFDHIMRLVRKFVSADFPNVRDLMDEAANPLQYIDLSKLSLAELKIFCEALDAAYVDAEKAGSNSFASVEFYLGFMERFRELRDLLHKNT